MEKYNVNNHKREMQSPSYSDKPEMCENKNKKWKLKLTSYKGRYEVELQVGCITVMILPV